MPAYYHPLLALLFCLFASSGQANDAPWHSLSFITEEYPPYNYTESEIARGITVDVLLEAAELAGLPLRRRDIRALPWARGYQMAQQGPGVMLFSMTRTAERDPLFKWVGPIMDSRIVLLARADRGLQLAHPYDLRRLHIGVIRDDIGHQLLNGLGLGDPQLHIDSSAIKLANLLERGRLDAWAFDEASAYWFIHKLDLDHRHFTAAYVLKQGEMFFAFSPDSSDADLQRLQQGLDELKRRPRYREIIQAYR